MERLDEYFAKQDRDWHEMEEGQIIKDLEADRKAMIELLGEIKTWTQGWATDNNIVYMPPWFSRVIGWLNGG